MATPPKIQDRLKPSTIIKNEYGGSQQHSPRFIIGYWAIRGLGAPLRMLLSASQIDHWVVLYDVYEKPEGGWDLSSWFNDKAWLKQDFPLINLPFLVDCAEDRVVSQTNALFTYLGRELNMLGSTVQETSQCEELLCEIMDLRNSMTGFAYGTADEASSTDQQDAAHLVAGANAKLKKLESWLMKEYPDVSSRVIDRAELDTIGFHAKGVCHLVGGKFSAPDFHLWEMLDQFEGLCKHYGLPSCLGTATTCSDQVDKIQTGEDPPERITIFPHLKEFHEGFIQLLANQAYATKNKLNGVADDTAIALPYNNTMARFGATPGTQGQYKRGQAAPWTKLGVQRKVHTRIDTGIEHWESKAKA